MLAGYGESLPLLPGADRAVRALGERWPLGLASSTSTVAILSPVVAFTPEGRYNLMIARPDIPKIAANNRVKGTPEENKAVVGRWFTEFWGENFNPDVIGELAAPDIRFEYSLHTPCRGRDEVRAFATKFRAAFPDLAFGATADLIAESD